jgi:hypothetical protein
MGSYELKDGNLSSNYERIGLDGTGTFTQTGGTNAVTTTLVLGQNPGSSGIYNLSEPNPANPALLTTKFTDVGRYGTGEFNQTGGTHTVTGDVTIAVKPGSSGTYNLSGGTLTAANIINNGTFNYTGGDVTVTNLFKNNAGGLVHLSGSGTRTVNGDVTNYGTFKVTSSGGLVVQYTGTFTNSGAYISDPATHSFNNLIIDPQAYIQAVAGDLFSISGNFLNSSTNTTDWNTSLADLEFTPGLHNFKMGLNNKFEWDMFTLTGVTLNLLGGDIWVDELIGFNIANISGTGIIHFNPNNPDNQYLMAMYSNGVIDVGGSTQPVPEPSTLLLLGSGLLGAAGFLRRRFKKN